MAKTILYCTAGEAPTVNEQAAIDKLKALTAQAWELRIINGKPAAKITATTISAAAADNSLNDAAYAAAGFLKAGFKAGQIVDVWGFTGDVANNVRSATIESVTAAKMILAGAAGAAIANNAAGQSVTISTIEVGLFGNRPIAADYIAGTVPASYSVAGTPIYPVIDPDDPPDSTTLPAGQTVLSNGESVDLDEGGTVTFTVEDGDITEALLETDEAVATDGDKITVAGAEVTLTVAAAAIGGTLPANKAIVASAQQIAVTGGGHVILTIAAGAITGCAYTAP